MHLNVLPHLTREYNFDHSAHIAFVNQISRQMRHKCLISLNLRMHIENESTRKEICEKILLPTLYFSCILSKFIIFSTCTISKRMSICIIVSSIQQEQEPMFSSACSLRSNHHHHNPNFFSPDLPVIPSSHPPHP